MIPTWWLAAGLVLASLGIPQLNTPGKFDNLQVFPLTSTTPAPAGRIDSLPDALKNKTVEIRELQGTPNPINEPANAPPVQQTNVPNVQQQVQQQVQQRTGGGASVNTLEIANKSSTPLFILAGTIVKGGKQDRQIGEDVLIPPHKSQEVKAFCVEHGRWNEQREGQATDGKFIALTTLANQEVRYAGQHKGDQSLVWEKVENFNTEQKNKPVTGTLLASLEDPKIKADHQKRAGEVRQFLARQADRHHQIGFAYTVNGQFRAARWFANHALYAKFEEVLINTAAFEAIVRKPEGDPKQANTAQIQQILEALRQAPVKEQRQTKGDLVNVFRETADQASSEATLKALVLSTDVVAK